MGVGGSVVVSVEVDLEHTLMSGFGVWGWSFERELLAAYMSIFSIYSLYILYTIYSLQ